MGLNNTPSGERVHIGIFGKRNAGKSSLINALTGQSLAIVSDVKGTTTDPVLKSMELLPIGPVVIIDTPGLDDDGELGQMRVRKAYQMLNRTDVAILVIDGNEGLDDEDEALIAKFKERELPYIVVVNKLDVIDDESHEELEAKLADTLHIFLSANGDADKNEGVRELKERLGVLANQETERVLIKDLIEPSDVVVLVVPIDKAAPKGRLILPQQMVIRDILDAGAVAMVCKEDELANTLARLGEKPKLVVTDSQVFGKVSKIVPEDVYLTSFSILMARYKGDLNLVTEGALVLDELEDGDKILIAEGCTHHRQCGDIGTEKLPAWILKYSGKNIEFCWCHGTEFEDDLAEYKLIVHCGACMLNEKEMKYRQRSAVGTGIPITNYGTAIAHMNGILKRSLEILNK